MPSRGTVWSCRSGVITGGTTGSRIGSAGRSRISCHHPLFLLSDSDKRKLALYWIARQRRYADLFKYGNSPVTLCTYFPDKRQLNVRRGERQPLLTFRTDLEPVDTPPANELLQDPRQRSLLVYCIQGGKGADLARNKNIPLSYIVDNNLRRQGLSDVGVDDWLARPFGAPHIQGEPPPYTWESTYTGEPGSVDNPYRNDPYVLDVFLQHYNPVVLQILDQFGVRLGRFISSQNLADVAEMFGLTELSQMIRQNAPLTLPKQIQDSQELQGLMQLKTTWVQQYGGRISDLVDDEMQLLAQFVLYYGVPEVIERYNSSPVRIAKAMA